MKPTLATRVWRAALGLSVVFSLVAAVATGSETTPEATQPAGWFSWFDPSTAAVTAHPGRVRDQLVALAPTPSATQSTDSSRPDDVSRLRARELALPIAAVRAAQLTDTYTQSRAGGVPHEALDIMAPRGTPVLAVEDGRVVKLFLSRQGGITLYQFDPTDEYVYYYAHLDRYADGVTEGDLVRKGQVIGFVGSTGNALPDAPHLHFAVLRLGPERQWWRGTPINPFLIWRTASR